MSQSKDLKKGIEMTDEELMEMTGGEYYMPCQKKYNHKIVKPIGIIPAPEYGITPVVKYGIVMKYGVQPLYGIKTIGPVE